MEIRVTVITLVFLFMLGFAVNAAEPTEQAVEKRITLDVRDADLRSVLITIFNQAGINYTLAEDVRGSVTAYIEDQPVDQTLRVILSPRGYVWRIDGGVYLVSKKAEPKQEDFRYVPPADPIQPEIVSDNDSLDVKTEKIALNYIDAYDLVDMLRGEQVNRGARDFGMAGTMGGYPGGQFGQWGTGMNSNYGLGNNNNWPDTNGVGYQGPNNSAGIGNSHIINRGMVSPIGASSRY